MPIVIYCEKCDAKQPKDWKSGDLCTNCGAGVREEQRCSWCVKLTPKGKFCKHCGNEVQPDKYFGAARILKNLGVNQLELTQKLQELPEAKLEQYQRQYNRHYAIVERALQDTKRLEEMLVIKGQEKFTLVEEHLLQRIPFDEEFLQKAEDYCNKHFESDEDFLEQREKLLSPNNRQLAELASLRWFPKRDWQGLHSVPQLIMSNICSDYCSNKVEFALYLGHINTFNESFNWEPFIKHAVNKNTQSFVNQFVDTLDPLLDFTNLKPYAAVALVHTLKQLDKTDYAGYERYKEQAKEALDHPDLSLRFSAGLLFNRHDVIVLIGQKETALGSYAVKWLLNQQSDQLAKIINGNTLTDFQYQVVEECFLNISENYWQELKSWKAQRKRIEEKNREKRYQLIRKEDIQEVALEAFEKTVLQEIETHHQSKPEAPHYHTAFVDLSPFVITSLHDKRLFQNPPYENEKEASYLTMLRFVGLYGTLSQQDLDIITENIAYYNRSEAILSLLTDFPAEGLNYSEAEQFYFSRIEAYKDYDSGFKQLKEWVLLIENNYYPSIKSLQNALLFIKVHQGFVAFQDDANRDVLLNILESLLDAPNEISNHTAQFVIHQILDLNNFMLSEWYVQMALRRNLCNSGHYFTEKGGEIFKYQVTDDFINHFFEGSYENFMSHYNRMLALRNHCRLFENWIQRTPFPLANYLQENPALALESLKSHKTAILHSLHGILNIKTEDNYYPMIEALGQKKWDMGDVILYYHRASDLFYDQPNSCLNRLTEWLTAEEGKNFYMPNFEKYAVHFFNFSVKTERIPFGMLNLWLKEAAATRLTEKKKKFYDDKFGSLVPTFYNRPLPTISYNGQPLPLKASDVIEYSFNGFDNLVLFTEQNFAYGLSVKTNRFILLVLYHAKDKIISLCQNESEKLRSLIYSLISLAKHPQNEKNLNESWLPAIVETLVALEKGNVNKHELINNIWSLGGLHFAITDKVYEYVTEGMIGYIESDREKGITTVYNFFEDYFYSGGGDVRWVREVLEKSEKNIAEGLSADDGLMNHIGKLVLSFLARMNNIADRIDVDQKRILDKLSDHFLRVMEDISSENLTKEFINKFYDLYEAKSIDGIAGMKWSSFMDKRNLKTLEESEESRELEGEDSGNSNQGSIAKKVIPDEIDYDPEEIHLELANISMMMGSFKVNQEEMTLLINHLPYYKKDKSDNPMLHSLLLMKQNEIITYLKDDFGTAIQLYQKLFEILIDPLCAPDGPFASYGQMSALVLPQLLEGSIFKQQYVSSIETMMNTGAYSKLHSEMLENLLNQLKSQPEN